MNATPLDLYPDPVESDFAATDTTAMATETTLLNPRFYTTDFDEMDRIDVTPVRPAWDRLIAQMKSDPNKGHFKSILMSFSTWWIVKSPVPKRAPLGLP